MSKDKYGERSTRSGEKYGDQSTSMPSPTSSGHNLSEFADVEKKSLAERFDLLGEIGIGGMGRVLKAFDRNLKRTVAIKRLKPTNVGDGILLTSLIREAQLAGRLNHPNVVTVYDILADDEGPYLVLEFVDGKTLVDRLSRGPMPWKEAIDLLLPICDAVIAAHAQGIIHRDIKPANILLSKNGTPKLGDFGIARMLEATDFTQTEAVMGTPAYMAPEQMKSSKFADPRADIYSLAATLCHMVTGDIPRTNSAAELPNELKEIVLRGLSRHPDDRQQTVLEFAKDLATLSTQPSFRPRSEAIQPRTKDASIASSANALPVDRQRRDSVRESSPTSTKSTAEVAHVNKYIASMSQLHTMLLTSKRSLFIAWIIVCVMVFLATAAARFNLYEGPKNTASFERDRQLYSMNKEYGRRFEDKSLLTYLSSWSFGSDSQEDKIKDDAIRQQYAADRRAIRQVFDQEMKAKWSEPAAMALGFFLSLAAGLIILYAVGIGYPHQLKKRLSRECESLNSQYPDVFKILGGSSILLEPEPFAASVTENAGRLSINVNNVSMARNIMKLSENSSQSIKSAK